MHKEFANGSFPIGINPAESRSLSSSIQNSWSQARLSLPRPTLERPLGSFHRHVWFHGIFPLPSRAPFAPRLPDHGTGRGTLALCQDGQATLVPPSGRGFGTGHGIGLYALSIPSRLSSQGLDHPKPRPAAADLGGNRANGRRVVWNRRGHGMVGRLETLARDVCGAGFPGRLHAESAQVYRAHGVDWVDRAELDA